MGNILSAGRTGWAIFHVSSGLHRRRTDILLSGTYQFRHLGIRGQVNAPPSPQEYLKLKTRIVELHPMTIIQNARTSGGGNISLVPTEAATVGPFETFKAQKVSIWHAGTHDNPFGQRLTTLMIGKQLPDSSVPMSLLALHPNVQFNFYRPGIGQCRVEMH
jgi:glucosamine-6-phosphate deaminase